MVFCDCSCRPLCWLGVGYAHFACVWYSCVAPAVWRPWVAPLSPSPLWLSCVWVRLSCAVLVCLPCVGVWLKYWVEYPVLCVAALCWGVLPYVGVMLSCIGVLLPCLGNLVKT